MIFLSFVPEKGLLQVWGVFKKKFNERNFTKEMIFFERFEKNKDKIFWCVHKMVFYKKIRKKTNSIEGYHRHINYLTLNKQSKFNKIRCVLIKVRSLVENYFLFSFV